MSVQQVEATTGRDENGRFTTGNPGGPGNTGARRVAQLRRLLLSKISDEDAGAIMDRLIQMAKEGNLSAIKLVLDYTVGKPGPVHLLSDPYEAAPAPAQQQGANAPLSPSPPPDLMRQIEDAIKMPQALVNLPTTTLPKAANRRH